MNIQQRFVYTGYQTKRVLKKTKPPVRKDRAIKINVGRMNSALNSEFFTMPKNMNKDEMRQFISECARKG